MTDNAGVAVFGSSQTEPGSVEWEDARRAGVRLAEEGYPVITGGYGGIMEAVSSGAAGAGGHVIGVTAPVDVLVHRREIYDAVRAANQTAAQAALPPVAALAGRLRLLPPLERVE